MPAPGGSRAQAEIEHGRLLAMRDPEGAWGWGTPAGRLRAERRAAMIVAGAGLRPGMRVLEIGCGTGAFTEVFARTGAQIVAVDISGPLLDVARRRGLAPDQVQFLEQQFESCTIDGGFDAVIGNSILHHLNLDAALRHIHGLLAPGGALAFAEPNMLNPQVYAERTFLRSRLWYVSPDETAFVRWRLTRDLEQAGFTGVRVRPFDWLHPAVPTPLVGPVTGIGRLLEALPLVREFAGSLQISGRRR